MALLKNVLSKILNKSNVVKNVASIQSIVNTGLTPSNVKNTTSKTPAPKKPAAPKKTTPKKAELVKVENPIVETPTQPSEKIEYPIVVVLDPGHAKSTPGKKSPYSLGKQPQPVLPFEEWQFNREIVNLIKSELDKLGIESFITTDEQRDKDTDLGLSARAQRGYSFVKKSGKKGIFISIHADAHGYGDQWTSANGWSTYTTKGQTISDKFADILYDESEKVFKPLGKKIRTDKTDGDRDQESNFTVIYKTEQLSGGKVPAVLVENFFYTNIEDTKYITSDKGKSDIVNVIINGILRYKEIFK